MQCLSAFPIGKQNHDVEVQRAPNSPPPEPITQKTSRRACSSAEIPLNPVDSDREYVDETAVFRLFANTRVNTLETILLSWRDQRQFGITVRVFCDSVAPRTGF